MNITACKVVSTYNTLLVESYDLFFFLKPDFPGKINMTPARVLGIVEHIFQESTCFVLFFVFLPREVSKVRLHSRYGIPIKHLVTCEGKYNKNMSFYGFIQLDLIYLPPLS